MMHSIRSISYTILCVLLCQTVAHAQDDEISVNARISQHQSYVGEILEYQIVVNNAKPDGVPKVRWPKGIQASFAGSNTINQRFSSLDPQTGRMKMQSQNTELFTFRLIPSGHGQFTIPASDITINGKAYPINPVTFTIIEPPEAEDFDLVMEIDRTTVFVGETLRLRLSWYLTSSVSEYSFRPSQKPDSFEVASGEDSTRTSRRDQLYTIDIFGIRTVGRLRDSTYKGKKTRVLYFELLVSPTQPGTYDMGPFAVLFDRRTNRGTNTRTISRSNSIVLEVKAPPTIGQPAGYRGLIGRYEIQAQASPTSAHVGEPIDLTVTVRGTEPITRVRNGPDLQSLPGFTDDFRLSPDGWQQEPSRPGERVFSTKIRAVSGEVTGIPQIRLPYFDPVKAEYQTATTKAIPLSIESVRTTTIQDAIGTGTHTPSTSAASLERAGPIFWAEDRGPSLLRRDPVSVLAIAQSPIWISAAVIPPAFYAFVFVVGVWKRSRNPELTRILLQLKRAQRAASRGELTAATLQAIETTLGVTPDAITSADAKRLPISDEHQRCLGAVLQTRESAFDSADHDQIREPEMPEASQVAGAIAAIRFTISRRTP